MFLLKSGKSFRWSAQLSLVDFREKSIYHLAVSSPNKRTRAIVFHYYGRTCFYCHCSNECEMHGGLVIDHVISHPNNHPSNLVPACNSCNLKKGGKDLDKWKPEAYYRWLMAREVFFSSEFAKWWHARGSPSIALYIPK